MYLELCLKHELLNIDRTEKKADDLQNRWFCTYVAYYYCYGCPYIYIYIERERDRYIDIAIVLYVNIHLNIIVPLAPFSSSDRSRVRGRFPEPVPNKIIY